jgi:hypothetical protein
LSNIEGDQIVVADEVPSTASNAAAAGTNGETITCRRLDNILKERDIHHVDLWSLDIEGFEFKAL